MEGGKEGSWTGGRAVVGARARLNGGGTRRGTHLRSADGREREKRNTLRHLSSPDAEVTRLFVLATRVMPLLVLSLDFTDLHHRGHSLGGRGKLTKEDGGGAVRVARRTVDAKADTTQETRAR